jgi:hypothetical protein
VACAAHAWLSAYAGAGGGASGRARRACSSSATRSRASIASAVPSRCLRRATRFVARPGGQLLAATTPAQRPAGDRRDQRRVRPGDADGRFGAFARTPPKSARRRQHVAALPRQPRDRGAGRPDRKSCRPGAIR